MKLYTFSRVTHKWFGIFFAAVLLNISVTGLLLLEKKNFSWIQPNTMQGTPGTVDQFITNQQLFEKVFSQGHKDFQDIEDIDRVDFRPGKRIFKVRSKKNNTEIQVDAITGDILSIAVRRSDQIETLHDGSLFGGLFYRIVMPVTAAVTGFLVITGLLIWLIPLMKRRFRRQS